MLAVKQKPAKCPKCGSNRIAEFRYGTKTLTIDIQKDIDNGKVVLGGCCQTGFDPLWYCNSCQTEIYLKKDFTFAEKVIYFNENMDFKDPLPKGVRIMNPFKDNPEALRVSNQFYDFFYHDYRERHLILGINPGRFGAGITGVPFTDTKRMWERCGIEIKGFESHETSSVFIYDMIDAYGGVVKFYSDFYINSVCPLGFTALGGNGKEVNFNYYDSKELTSAVNNFIVESLTKQLQFPIKRDVCFCLGTGKNYDFLLKLNKTYHFFEKLIPLEHPRYIMQYKLRKKDEYIKKYITLFNSLPK